MKPTTRLITLALILFRTLPLAAEEYATREHYTKYEYMVPMRDGARLYTAAYVPKDTSRSWPILMERTPYSVGDYGTDHYRLRLGPDHFSHLSEFAEEGFIFLYQDVRGRYHSEGEFREMTPHISVKNGPQDVDESTDAYDTIEWALENIRNHNGRVGLWGISYMGFYAAAGMIDAHPALKAVSPQAPVIDIYDGDDGFHNGAFMLTANFGFYSTFFPREGPAGRPKPQAPVVRGTPDGYDYYLRLGPLANAESRLRAKNWLWDDYLIHTTYDDFWKRRALQFHLKNIRPAVLTVGGWYDAEDPVGPLYTYRAIEANKPLGPNSLVMGPWRHVGWEQGDGDRLGNLRFHVKTSKWFRENLQLPFFRYHLKDDGDGEFAKAYIFETGTNRWRTFDAWPPAGVEPKPVYLSERGALAWDMPTAETGAFDEYVSDPNKPVPYLPYPNFGMAGDYMTEDQRFAAQRTDVLVWESEVLTEDLTIAGPIPVELHVSVSGTDADFVVKVIDVYPGDFPDNAVPVSEEDPDEASRVARYTRKGGYQLMVRGEPFRGKFRHSLSKPEPFEPGKVEIIRLELPDVAHTFRRDHRMMIQVQSSWFPLVDRNPQTFTDIPNAQPADFQKATHRVWRTRAHPSSVTLPVLR